MVSFFKSKPLEKRKFKRLKTALNVKFNIISGEDSNQTSSSIKAIAKDISPYSIGLESSIVEIDRMHVSHDSSTLAKNKLNIELELPSKDKGKDFDSIHFLGEVAWYDKKNIVHQYAYLIGVEIKEISEEDRSKLEAFINC